MKKQQIEVTATTTAPAQTVYDLLRDGASWPAWSPIESFELVEPGKDGGESLDAVRVFTTGRIHSRERIVELRPHQRLSYVLESGLAIRDYRADIDLTTRPAGTTIQWRSSFYPKIPGMGWIYRRTLTTFITRCIQGLVAYTSQAEHRSDQG